MDRMYRMFLTMKILKGMKRRGFQAMKNVKKVKQWVATGKEGREEEGT